MGQTLSSGTYFSEAEVKEQYVAVQTLWSEQDLANLLERLKEMTLNFSLDRVKFAKLLQLSISYEELVAKWFEDFSHDRASQVVDGLEFLSAAIMISSKVGLFRKTCLLFQLFDLDKTGCIRKDEFTIFLKAVTTGLHRVVKGLPPPATVLELGSLSADFFASLSRQVLSQQDLLMWMTEAHYSLNYLSVLSRLGTAIFAWGQNYRYQLGLNLEPKLQRAPSPVLALEGVGIAKVASSESHCLFLTSAGQVWTCGSGFCGILGQGSLLDCPQPRLIESLAHTRILDVACGVRHSVAVSEKGQVFTWGSADMGQLGHGDTADREVHEWAFDPRSGGNYTYVSKPTVVMGLFGRRIVAKTASCCNFSTAILTDQGHVYAWGNNTDGQCGQGQRNPAHKLVFVDPHMQRTAMQALMLPHKLEPVGGQLFKQVTCGGYHMLALDVENRVWTWGQGMWGKLGHVDQRSMYEAKMVESLKYHICTDLAAGEAHSLCLCSLYRLTITGSAQDVPLQPFSLLGLPTGRVDRHAAMRQMITPPGTQLQLNAFVSAKLLQVALPYKHDSEQPVISPDQHSFAEVQESVLLVDRALWEGEWLKLNTTDYDFRVKFSPAGAQVSARTGLTGDILFCAESKYEAKIDFVDKICVFELPATDKVAPQDLTPAVLELALQCQQGRGLACLVVLPKGAELFAAELDSSQAPPEAVALQSMPFGVLTFEHGAVLKKHITELINSRIAEAPEGVPDEVKDWRECREDFTGRIYFENIMTTERRWAPPQIAVPTAATLLIVNKDHFMDRLKALLNMRPKGVIVCQQSWKPDVELVTLPEAVLTTLDIPVVLVTYEAGQELKNVFQSGSLPLVTMEIQPYGGVCAWGNGTFGQLGLSGIENQNFMTTQTNMLTNEDNTFSSQPCYVAHLHEHQVVNLACGGAHTVAVTQQGEVLAWGLADGLGVQIEADKEFSDVPCWVEHLEGIVKASKAFAGHNHSFVVADMPFKSVI